MPASAACSTSSRWWACRTPCWMPCRASCPAASASAWPSRAPCRLSPDAIIADEPTSALDVSVRAQILNLLMDLKRDLGLSMVFISHDIQTVRYISDQIIVMNAGEAVERGAAKDVFEHPKDAYTKLLLGAAPSLLHPELGK